MRIEDAPEMSARLLAVSPTAENGSSTVGRTLQGEISYGPRTLVARCLEKKLRLVFTLAVP